MAEVTVEQFAEVLKVPVDKLLLQLDEAGIKVSGSRDVISDDAKLELLTHLRRSHGQDESSAGDAAPRKITLKRKSQSELRLPGAQGRSRTVSVEVRRKRTYIKRDVLEKQAQEEQAELDRQRQASGGDVLLTPCQMFPSFVIHGGLISRMSTQSLLVRALALTTVPGRRLTPLIHSPLFRRPKTIRGGLKTEVIGSATAVRAGPTTTKRRRGC